MADEIVRRFVEYVNVVLELLKVEEALGDEIGFVLIGHSPYQFLSTAFSELGTNIRIKVVFS